MITWKCDEHWKRQEMFSPSLLSDTPQRSPGLIRHYCVHQRAHTRVRSCDIQAQCPSKQPSSLPCKSPTLFPGSTTCLNILLLVRLPVYRAARALHSTWDMNSHSSSSVITFYCSNSGSSRTPSHHTIVKSSLTPRTFRSGVLNHNGFLEYTEILVLTKTTIQF
jgi:hypothetical protein